VVVVEALVMARTTSQGQTAVLVVEVEQVQ
jgi:hypothetical protein